LAEITSASNEVSVTCLDIPLSYIFIELFILHHGVLK